MKTKNQTHNAVRHLLYSGLLAAGLLGAAGAQAATLAVDLATGDSGQIGDVIFSFDTQQPTGTGVLDPFLRIQKNGSEQGYNTSFTNPPVLDDKTPVNYTHDLAYGSLVADGGYFSFVLDINEPAGDKGLLSLDGLKFFTGPGGQSTEDVNTLGTPLWDMDHAEQDMLGNWIDNYVLLDYNRNDPAVNGSGSGRSDMLLTIPVSVFAGLSATDNIILWSQFGLQGGDMASGDGFEEWAHILSSQEDFCTLHPNDPSCGEPPPPLPEPGMLALIGLGMLSMAVSYRRRVTI